MTTDRTGEQRQETLSNADVATAVYQSILHKYPHEHLDFQDNPPSTVVADDSDWHSWGSNRLGIMFYDEVSLVTVGETTWFLALGTRTKGYPADDFSFDLKAFQYDPTGKTDEQTLLDVRREIKQEGTTFPRSILTGLSGRGMLINDRYKPSAQLGHLIRADFNDLIAQKPELDPDALNLPGFGPPIMKTAISYTPASVDIIAGAISQALSSNS